MVLLGGGQQGPCGGAYKGKRDGASKWKHGSDYVAASIYRSLFSAVLEDCATPRYACSLTDYFISHKLWTNT